MLYQQLLEHCQRQKLYASHAIDTVGNAHHCVSIINSTSEIWQFCNFACQQRMILCQYIGAKTYSRRIIMLGLRLANKRASTFGTSTGTPSKSKQPRSPSYSLTTVRTPPTHSSFSPSNSSNQYARHSMWTTPSQLHPLHVVAIRFLIFSISPSESQKCTPHLSALIWAILTTVSHQSC